MEIDHENITNFDDENEMNLLNRNKAKTRHKILDSDSEPETQNENEHKNVLEDPNETLNSESDHKTKLKRVAAFDSDSDEQNEDPKQIESDSKVSEIVPNNENSTAEEPIFSATSNGKLIVETLNVKKSGLVSLYDSESSAEEDEIRPSLSKELDLDEPVLKPVKYKPPHKNKNKNQPKMMTAQEASKQRTEITSESQRMLRERNVSLPYHKPKTYSIKEFLQKRSKLASAVPSIPQGPPSIAIKMTKDQLVETSRKLDERIKEVERFYKSDSDDDEEEKGLKEEITSWLNLMADAAVDDVETRRNESILENHDPETKNQKITNFFDDRLLNIHPKLSGTADDVIDLDQGVTKPSAVKKLMEKLLQHAVKKAPHKHKVELDIIEVSSGGDIVKETVSMNVDEEEEPAMVETPGAKLKKLKEELQKQMALKRLELWKQKQDEGDCVVGEKKLEGADDNAEKDILDDEDEEEYEMTESDSDEMEEDEEEYLVRKEKQRVKSAFVEDEADDDDMDVDDDETSGVVDEEEIPEKDGFEADIEEATEHDETQSPKRKVLRRIVKPFTEDSENEDDDEMKEATTNHLKYFNNAEDDVLSPNLPKTNKTPRRTQIDKNKSEFDFLTPVTYLTGLNNLNTSSKYSKQSPVSPSPSPSKSNSQSSIQKNLFPESCDLDDESRENSEDLEQISFEKFPETQDCVTASISVEDSLPTTQDLLNVCSGDFNTIPETADTGVGEKIVIQASPQKEIKHLDDDQDQIISQLLDEDELERFKKKFESPMINKTQVVEEYEEVNATGLINSDEENEELEITRKRRQKKLVFSDEEDENNEGSDDLEDDEDDEDIDLHDNVDEDDEEQILENQLKAKESSNFKLTDFLDKEAELSESDWGSDDEDEKGLDVLDVEEGDLEQFNENKMRSELERIHMRQVLDDDNREVKLLQELLLDDGELHGTGRKRQFRWKSLNEEDNGEFEKRGDDDIFLDDEESEEQWRKMRHKREMFLKKKSTSAADDEEHILNDCKILKVGKQIVTNKSFSSQNNTPVNTNEESEEPFSLLSKRGSFLSRSDQVLQRLAEFNKVSNSGASTMKNSKCFIFQTIETSETVTIKDNNNKRKATEGTPNIIKKLRLSDLSPAVGKNTKSQRAKTLFGQS